MLVKRMFGQLSNLSKAYGSVAKQINGGLIGGVQHGSRGAPALRNLVAKPDRRETHQIRRMQIQLTQG